MRSSSYVYLYIITLLVCHTLLYSKKETIKEQVSPDISLSSVSQEPLTPHFLVVPVSEHDTLYAPITFSHNGIEVFLRDTYNKTAYTTDILPNSFDHIIQLLEHGKKTHQHSAFVKSIMKLFNQKIKAAPYINPDVISNFLDKLPELTQQQFVSRTAFNAGLLQEVMNDILYSSFLSKFSHFKKDPEDFLNTLTHDIIRVLPHNEIHEEQLSIEATRQATLKLIDTSISKLIWNPRECYTIWNSVTTIADKLTHLMEHNIITSIDDLDDLYWTLIHRFCYFIDLVGQDVPLDFYTAIKNDIQSGSLLFLDLQEQEPYITSKAEHLMTALLANEARKRAHDYGIIS